MYHIAYLRSAITWISPGLTSLGASHLGIRFADPGNFRGPVRPICLSLAQSRYSTCLYPELPFYHVERHQDLACIPLLERGRKSFWEWPQSDTTSPNQPMSPQHTSARSKRPQPRAPLQSSQRPALPLLKHLLGRAPQSPCALTVSDPLNVWR